MMSMTQTKKKSRFGTKLALILMNQLMLIFEKGLSTVDTMKIRNWNRFLLAIVQMSGSTASSGKRLRTPLALERKIRRVGAYLKIENNQ